MLIDELIAKWPGKSGHNGGPEHPALFHMIDVAAVAEVLLQPVTLAHPIKQALVFLTALHDIGKLNAGFRAMLRGEGHQTYRHWELTEVYLDALRPELAKLLSLPKERVLGPLISATAGHHGRPADLAAHDFARARAKIDNDVGQAISLLAALWPDANLAGVSSQQSYELSWWLSGLVTTADWIGSNTEWFAACGADLSLEQYLALTRAKAANAVSETGVKVVHAIEAPLFDFHEMRPMQSTCQSVPLADGPTLAIIEDETGAGKTEAAMMLAQRMLIAAKGTGLFFALPTMATADAMFSRVSRDIGKMFRQKPSVTLAHGRAGLSAEYRDLQLGNPNAPEDVGCTDWLADSRRRSLLANVGIGTVDQALLSVLPVKFQTLRHYGLSSKILIVDEVHELGEPYIAETLVALLRLHRAAGGSAILLTATLPIELRAKLLAAYDGLDDGHSAYPALTIAGVAAVRDLPQETGAKGAVSIERLENSQAAVALLTEMSSKGAACVWIRNAVDDAIAAVADLRAAGIEAELLHARYALGDRKRIEQSMRDRFGKTGVDRQGRVLVGTQVLESSLDLDFDVMVSDLAPMAGLVQRVGRLWRHMDIRPTSGRPVPEPVLYVVSPDPTKVADERWLMSAMDRGAYTYSADVMWRTAFHLFEEGRIVAPSGIRPLIERAYSSEPATPGALETFEQERIGKECSHQSLATMNIVNIAEGYGRGGKAHDDATYPTRLGPEQQVVILAKDRNGILAPYIDGPDGWAMSEVPAPKRRLERVGIPDQNDPKIVSITDAWPDWMRGKYLVFVVGDDGEIAEGLAYYPDKGLVFSA